MTNINDPNGYLPEDWQGTVRDLLELDIPAEHRLELALQPGLIDDKTLLLFGVWCERQILNLKPHRQRLDAVEVTEKYILGQATVDEFIEAWDDDSFTTDEFAYESAQAHAAIAASHAVKSDPSKWVPVHEATMKGAVAHLRDMLKDGRNGQDA